MTTDVDAAVPTLEMVAAIAGVSRSTVSRVINASPKVTPEAVAAVNAAIEALNYVPNRAARSLASRKTNSIALIVAEDTAKFFADPYFASVIQGAATYLSRTDYTLTLLIASRDDPMKTHRYLRGGNADGALILSHHSDDRLVQLAHLLPVVFGGRPTNPNGDDLYVVDVDNVAAASAAGQYLIDHGKKRIATISGPQDMAAGIDRVEGWRRTLEGAGLVADLIEEADFTPAGGNKAMSRLLDRGARFDGLFAASAQMASGAVELLRERGLSVPNDLGLTTIDNDFFAQHSVPPLTTIGQPSVEQGATMAKLLVKLIAGKEVPALTIMPTTLFERESV
jgi:LacI family transcriptional regulator